MEREVGVYPQGMDVGKLLHRTVYVLVSLMCTFFQAIGVLFCMHSIEALAMFEPEVLFDDGLQGLKATLVMLLTSCLLPFFDSAAMMVDESSGGFSEYMKEAMSMSVSTFWMPLASGLILFSYGLSGQLSMKFKHAACMVPFAFLAVVFLLWQVEVSQVLSTVAHGEEFTIKAGQTDLAPSQMAHYEMYKVSYDKFQELLDSTQCTVSTARGAQNSPINVQCKDDSVEAQVLQVFLQQFCQIQTSDNEFIQAFNKRVDTCKSQGRNLKILSAKSAPHEDAYCRCRLVAYDLLKVMTQWSMFVWVCQLLGVCAVLYFGVENNLDKMGVEARREILCFGALGLAALACSVVLSENTVLQLEPDASGE
eukprot:TRINITY_DN32430_c0_g1_i1.p1 TRINITY_DN32430_c0_g1~~TRINITY_DN32430_c0_g1_i1.p1  ORF type:complete len:365 (+),score=62.60 TRINITY_DN32430_c0_g1_i1:42-1136(+)